MIVLGLLEVVFIYLLMAPFFGLPLLMTFTVWLGGTLAGGALGQEMAGADGLLPGSVVGAGVFAGIYSGLISRYFLDQFLGAGAGWRYWKAIHKQGYPELPGDLTYRRGDTISWGLPTLCETCLDMAAACVFAVACFWAESMAYGAVAGLVATGLWGGVWGLYLGATVPRDSSCFIDINAASPANLFCPRSSPFAKYSLSWTLGCCIGYALQVIPLGILPGMMGGSLFANWREMRVG